MTEDTYRGQANDPLSLNLYTYCHNDPIMYKDPTGHWEEGDENLNADAKAKIKVYTDMYYKVESQILKNYWHKKAESIRNNPDNYKKVDEVGAVIEMPQKATDEIAVVDTGIELASLVSDIGYFEPESPDGVNRSTSMTTLEDLYKLDADKMRNQAIQINIKDNTVYIKVYINFTGDANDMFGNTNKTYAQLVAEGIEEKWNTTFIGSEYDFVKGLKGNVVTDVIYMIPGQIYYNNPDQKYMNIYIDNKGKGISHQRDWTTGSFITDVITGDWSFYNWSITNPGEIIMYKGYNGGEDYLESRYKAAAAHEFGHALGLGDAYLKDSKDRFLTPITDEVPRNDIMRTSTGIITANDIEMVLQAFSTNKFQGFIKHSWQNKKSSVIKLK